jgi:hypothetical protein
MNKVDLIKNKLAMQIVCMAIGEDFELIDKMVVDENHLREIVFSVGGVELDFNRVIKHIDEIFDESVEIRAKEMVKEKYQEIVDRLSDISQKAKEIIPFNIDDDGKDD